MPLLLNELQKSDRDALISALTDTSISVRGICEALCSEGFSISRDAVTRGRLCLTGQYPCKCDISATRSK